MNLPIKQEIVTPLNLSNMKDILIAANYVPKANEVLAGPEGQVKLRVTDPYRYCKL